MLLGVFRFYHGDKVPINKIILYHKQDELNDDE